MTTVTDPSTGTDRLKWWVDILAPTGILVGLLYYFGYVTTDAWFRYFGLELSQVRLSQQAIVLQSIAALYLPVGALLILGSGVYALRRVIEALLSCGWRPKVVRYTAIAAVVAGALLVIRALVGIFVPDVARTEPIALSPLSLCAGTLLLVAGVDVLRGITHSKEHPRPIWATLTVWALVVLGLFWATNSLASAYGRGRAMDFARTLQDRPAVVMDTKERLFLINADVEENALSSEVGAVYRYRYRDLRLVAASEGWLYLAPASWRRGAGTVVVVPAEEVRLQFLR